MSHTHQDGHGRCGACGDAGENRRKREDSAEKADEIALPEDLAEPTFVPWPADQPARYNACTDPCDMWTGPCACGAWHKEGK